MELKVLLETQNKVEKVSLKNNSTVNSLLKEMKINPETVLVMRNGEFVIEGEALKEDDNIRIVSVK